MKPIPGNRGRWRLTLHRRQFSDLPWMQTLIAEITTARSRRLEQLLNKSAQLTFTISGRSPEATLITELATDVVAWRWDENRGHDIAYFRGIVGQGQDQITEQSHTINFTCHDYLAVMNRRFLRSLRNYTQVNQDALVASFITDANTEGFMPGSYLPLHHSPRDPDGRQRPSGQGGPPPPLNRDRQYAAAANLGKLLDDLSAVEQGFDYDVVPGWRYDGMNNFDVLRNFYPSQGIDRSGDLVLEYGSTVSTVDRTVNSTDYANYERLVGSNASTDVPAPYSEQWNDDANDITRVPFGLWMDVDNASDVTIQSTLDQQASGALRDKGLVLPSYTIGLRPDFYTEGLLNMGDTVPFIVNSGRLNVFDAMRVVGLTFDIGDDGNENVGLTLGRSRTTLTDLLRAGTADINALARR